MAAEWGQRRGDTFPKGSLHAGNRLDVEDKGGDGQSESHDAPQVPRCMVVPFGEGRKRFIGNVEQN